MNWGIDQQNRWMLGFVLETSFNCFQATFNTTATLTSDSKSSSYFYIWRGVQFVGYKKKNGRHECAFLTQPLVLENMIILELMKIKNSIIGNKPSLYFGVIIIKWNRSLQGRMGNLTAIELKSFGNAIIPDFLKGLKNISRKSPLKTDLKC